MSKHIFNFGSAHGKRGTSIVKRADCTAATFYKSPASGTTVSLNNGFDIQWDTSCIGQPTAVDISLLSPDLPLNQSSVHKWANVNFSNGQYTVQLNPSWYQSKASIKLQLSIVASGTPIFLQTGQTLPTGPIFTGAYNASAGTQLAVDSTPLAGNSSNQVTYVNNFYKGLTKGQVAAAVIMPILFVAACIAAYVFWTRRKEAQRRREYRENLDQRMSVAPGADWAPISAAGAAAAIRHSMAFSNVGGDRNTRASSFFGRPSSAYQGDPPQEMRQTRSRTDSTSEQTRISRVSFADTAVGRSTIDRPAVPPLPAAYRKSMFDAEASHSPDNENLSPTQREGAYPLDEDSIRDRLSGTSGNNGRDSVAGGFGADTLPALAMMRANESPDKGPAPPAPALTRESIAGDYRTYSIGAYSGNTDSIVTDNSTPSYFNPPANSSDPDAALRAYASRNPQMVPVTTTFSPFSGFASGPGLAAAAGFDLSPDAAFRAYAATRPTAPPTAVTPSTPSTVRTLYNPTMTQGLGLRPRADTLNSTGGDKNPYRDTMVSTNYDEAVGKAQ